MRVRAVAVMALVTLLVTGCGASRTGESQASPDAQESAAPTNSPAAEVPAHLIFSREAYHLMQEAGDQAWPGWADAVPPVVVALGDRHHVIGPPPNAGDWVEVGTNEWEGPRIETVAPGVQVLDGQPFAATLPVDELQKLIDQAVGVGVITLDPPRYIRFVVHEAFHAFQIATLDGDLPNFGLQGDERDLLPQLDEPDVADAVATEAEVLARGLRADTEADAIAAAVEFLALRRDRRDSMSDDAIALERSLEWTEGLARYADVSLSKVAAGDYEPTPAFAALGSYGSAGEVTDTLLGWLDDLTTVPGSVRDRYYEIGAAQALLLDRLIPGWHSRALPGREALESLLAAALEQAQAGIAPSLRALEARTISVGTMRLDVAVADRPAFWSSGLAGVDTLAPLGGLLFVFPEPVAAAFTNRGMAFGLDVFFFDTDGRLVDSISMPACEDGPCDAFKAAGAFQYALEVPSGSVVDLHSGDRLDPGRD